MVDFVNSVVRERLGESRGLAGDEVVVVDPAMGTGTFLVEVLRSVAATIDSTQGPGALGPRLREFFGHRLVGFEIQTAPYAVAELRLHEALSTRFGCDVPESESRFLTDALEDPQELGVRSTAHHRVIAKSRGDANRIKRDVQVMVVIGNPPHVKDTKGLAPWIESRRRTPHVPGQPLTRPSLDEFRAAGGGRYESDLYGLPWCFWRWGLWKAFEAHQDSPTGVVAFLTPSSFLRGRSFAGMREYLRRLCDEGWIVDLSPEGNRPAQATRIFGAAVGRQLCIAIFARYDQPNHKQPATIHTMKLTGSRSDKLSRLKQVELADDEWSSSDTAWQAPFAASATPQWRTFVPMPDLLPWSSRGVTAGRTWVYAPESATLNQRWATFLAADTKTRKELFGESRDRTTDSQIAPLPGFAQATSTLAHESENSIAPMPVAYRSFDRQWIIPDSRLLVMPRPPLWAVRSSCQVYATEQNSHPIESGPALAFSELIPDIDHFNVRSGRVFALYRDTTGQIPNIAPRLLQYLEDCLSLPVTAAEVLAYVAGAVAHGGFTRRFRSDLQVPGVRIPLTADPLLWSDTVAAGESVLWLHTFGQRYVDQARGRPLGLQRLVENHGPRVLEAIPDTVEEMPDVISYDVPSGILRVGVGAVGPVTAEVYAYAVGGMPVVKHWFNYRARRPVHKRRSSELDDINCRSWSPARTDRLLELLTVVDRCIALEPRQEQLLDHICDGPLITPADMTRSGVLPVPKAATGAPKISRPGEVPLF
jgi:predicted helicase